MFRIMSHEGSILTKITAAIVWDQNAWKKWKNVCMICRIISLTDDDFFPLVLHHILLAPPTYVSHARMTMQFSFYWRQRRRAAFLLLQKNRQKNMACLIGSDLSWPYAALHTHLSQCVFFSVSVVTTLCSRSNVTAAATTTHTLGNSISDAEKFFGA